MGDRATKRFVYLLTTAGLGTSCLSGVAIWLLSGLIAIGCFGAVIATMIFLGFRPDMIARQVGAGVLFSLLSFVGFSISKHSVERSQTIAYVPPVQDQLAAIPSSAILVRGSQLAESGSPELLRATKGEQQPVATELMRASDAANVDNKQ
jgi:hypothetical protein